MNETLVREYHSARDALNASLDLLQWSMDLREQLQWGVFDLDEAKAQIAELKRACEAHKARRQRMAA
jgi:hypothetical protein